MWTGASRGRSSFGMGCIQCANYLIAPDRSEYRDEKQITHRWQCPKCDCCFEVISPTDIRSLKDIMRRIEDVVARRGVLSSRLVA